MRPFSIMKKAIKYFFVIFSFVFSEARGQNYFNKVYDHNNNDDVSGPVINAYNSGYILLGESVSTTVRSMSFIRTDNLGDTIWTKYYGLLNDVYYCGIGGSLVKTKDSCYAVAGTYTYAPVGDLDGVIMKIDSMGDTLWQKKIGGSGFDEFQSLVQNPDGSYVMAGGTDRIGHGSVDAWLVKTDSAGNILWQKAYGGTGDDYAYSVSKTYGGGYILAGYTNSFGAGDWDVYIVKVDSLGNEQWQKTLGFAYSDNATGIIPTSDKGFFITGSISKNSGNSNTNCYAAKLDSAGNLIWQKSYWGLRYNEFDGKGIELSTGDFIVDGMSQDTAAPYNARGLLMKICSQGDSIWSRTYKKWDGENYFDGVALTPGDGFIVAGYATNGLNIGGGEDAWLMKTDSLGCDSIGCLPSTVNCHVTGINESEIVNQEFEVYPNPSSGNFTIKNNFSGNYEIEIFNSLGQEVFRNEKVNDKLFEVDLSEQASGIYFVRCISGEKIYTEKIVKE